MTRQFGEQPEQNSQEREMREEEKPEIRHATKEDIDAILRVGGEDEIKSKEAREYWLKTIETSQVVLVAEINGEIMGRIAVSEIPAKYHKHYADLWITNIDTAKKHEGRGIGTTLIKNAISMIEKLPEHKSIGLRVREDNRGAQRVYERCGFEKVSIPDKDQKKFAELKDAIIMTRNLPE